MAQRLIHYLLGEKLLEASPPGLRSGLFDARFRMGNLLPDAYEAGWTGLPPRRVTHLILTDGAGDRYSDFGAFLARFRDRIPGDGLYFGYYLHLIEDACFRVFWHGQKLDVMIRSQEDVSFLHRDYHILNRYLREKYAVENKLLPVSLEDEPVKELYPFRPEAMLTELAADLAEMTDGEPRWFTTGLADAFIAYALPVCTDALGRILAGEEPLDPHSLHWRPTA